MNKLELIQKIGKDETFCPFCSKIIDSLEINQHITNGGCFTYNLKDHLETIKKLETAII
jgi:hypothetical protein